MHHFYCVVFVSFVLTLTSERLGNGAKMADNYSWLTPKQVANLTGFTARHIQNLITQGKLSATKEDGKYYIDKSEVFRVFPKAHKKEQEGNIAQIISEKERLEFESSMLRDALSNKEKEVEFLRNQIEFISNEKLKMLETITSTTRLLDHKKDKNWSNIFRFKR